MKKILVAGIFILSQAVPAKEKGLYFTVINNQNYSRFNEVVPIRWSSVKNSIGEENPGEINVRDAKTNEEVASQKIDYDLDGNIDEFLVCIDIKAKEKRKFYISRINPGKKISGYYSDARLMMPREDVAWENDRIAFRMYGPPLASEVNNGIDVWVKRVRYPILEKWYRMDEAPPDKRISYHEDHGEGADLFNVWGSLGAGGCALFKDDSIYQPGVFDTSRIIAKGPLRAVFEVVYKPVLYSGKMIFEKVRIMLDYGSNMNRIDVLFTHDSKANQDLPDYGENYADETVQKAGSEFVAGLVKRDGVSVIKEKDKGVIALWGPVNDKSENGLLGTGIVAGNNESAEIIESKGHVLVLFPAEIGRSATYYAGAGWTRSGDFSSEKDWVDYLEKFSQRKKNPLEIQMDRIDQDYRKEKK